MDGFTLIDGVVAAIIVVSALLAYSRGFVREALAIAGWIAAAFVAFLFAPTVQPLIKEIPMIGPMIADSCELTIIAAFGVVFALALVIASLFTPLFSSFVQRSVLGGVDQGAGFIFGVVRGILLVAVAFFAYDTIVSAQDIAMIDDSRSARVFANLTGQIAERNPDEALGWIAQQYENLVGVCAAPN